MDIPAGTSTATRNSESSNMDAEAQHFPADRYEMKDEDFLPIRNIPWDRNESCAIETIKAILAEYEKEMRDAARDLELAATLFHADLNVRLKGLSQPKMKEEYVELKNVKAVFLHPKNDRLQGVVQLIFDAVDDYDLSVIGELRMWYVNETSEKEGSLDENYWREQGYRSAQQFADVTRMDHPDATWGFDFA
ncbi:hypothetical protein BD311DRAFT_696618 [Dichomitus squalens]|uniref:Uncharacterized protein n=1 Tax=Dichomitus squalens TaxID=114155 RepID=A0A4Q9MJA9_9APHY|nr:hypothetical protein BD311DRAFT_696618 [Dichomitus squalens]